MEKEITKNRQATEMTLIKAVNDIIEESGFEGLGINAVAAKAKVSKMLIYRYFNSLDGLIAAYIQADVQKTNHAVTGELYIETPVSLGTDNRQ